MSKIQWTGETWNPTVGCSIYSAGCANCYAMRMARRLEAMGLAKYAGLTQVVNGNVVWNGVVRAVPEDLERPLRVRKPTVWFVDSMSDLFHESLGNEDIARVFEVICRSLHDRPRERRHTYQILTKRAERMADWFAWAKREYAGWFGFDGKLDLGHVWLGVSVEDQRAADERIPHLLRTPIRVRFLSCEPLLGPVDLTGVSGVSYAGDQNGDVDAETHGIDWVIVGGESGSGARSFDVQWARGLVQQCRAAGVPVFVKQLGAKPYQRPAPPGAPGYLRLHDRKGGDMGEWPEDLRVREMPVVAR